VSTKSEEESCKRRGPDENRRRTSWPYELGVLGEKTFIQIKKSKRTRGEVTTGRYVLVSSYNAGGRTAYGKNSVSSHIYVKLKERRIRGVQVPANHGENKRPPKNQGGVWSKGETHNGEKWVGVRNRRGNSWERRKEG